MGNYESINHTKYECKCHVVFIPKYRKKKLYGYIKGKSAIWIARAYGESQRHFSGQHMRARGYFVSTAGLDEEVIREYIKNQEDDDRRQDELFD